MATKTNNLINETTISGVLGIIVVFIIGIFIFNYFHNKNLGQTFPNDGANQSATSQNEHTVTKGETLWSIAQDYYKDGFKWNQIAKANNIENPKEIEVGQILMIPGLETATASPAPSPVATATTSTASPTPTTTAATADNAPITNGVYTVVHGDNLWKIAERAYGDGNKWKEIAAANNLENPRVIHAGNVFKLPR